MKGYVVTSSICRENEKVVAPYDTCVTKIFMSKENAIKHIVRGAKKYFGSDFNEDKCVEGINEFAVIPYKDVEHDGDTYTYGYQLEVANVHN